MNRASTASVPRGDGADHLSAPCGGDADDPRGRLRHDRAALTAPVHGDADHHSAGEPSALRRIRALVERRSPSRAALEVASAVLDGKLYVAGGFGNPRGQVLDAFTVYDPATDTWTELAKLPESRHHGALAALDGRLYLTGGGVESFAPRANTWRYDPATDHWTALESMPAPRRAHAAVAVGGLIYVIGGVVEGRHSSPQPGPTTQNRRAARNLADLPTYREHLAAVAVEDAIVAIGGRGTQSVDAVERYDPATDVWTAMAPLPAARGGLAAVVRAATSTCSAGRASTRRRSSATTTSSTSRQARGRSAHPWSAAATVFHRRIDGRSTSSVAVRTRTCRSRIGSTSSRPDQRRSSAIDYETGTSPCE